MRQWTKRSRQRRRGARALAAWDPAGEPTRRGQWFPFATLLLALSSVFLFGGDRGYFYGYSNYPIGDWNSLRWMSLTANFSFQHGLLYEHVTRRRDGRLRYHLYGRFPAGGVALLKLATSPFEGDLSRQLFAARLTMLAFFCGAAMLAYLSVTRISGDRAIALAATSLTFGTYHMLGYMDVVWGEASMGLFGFLLVFHGIVLYAQEGRMAQLLARIAIALLLDWHVYALLAPFIAWGLTYTLWRAWRWARAGHSGAPQSRLATAAVAVAAAGLRSRHLGIGLFALLFGAGVLGYNAAQEYAAIDGARPVAELPVLKAMLRRTGVSDHYDPAWGREGAARRFLKWQFHRIGLMLVPHALSGRTELLRLPEHDWDALGAITFAPLGVLGLCACLVALCRGRRGRAPLAILAVSGIVWALAMRNHTVISNHDFQSVYYLGIPLALATLGLTGLRKMMGERGSFAVYGVAALAVGLFVWSTRMMAAARADPHQATVQPAAFADFDAMRRLAHGKDVLNIAYAESVFEAFPQAEVHLGYHLAGAIVHGSSDMSANARLEAEGCCDLVLSRRRLPGRRLLTPGTSIWFLYAAGGVTAAVQRARQRDLHALRLGERLADAHYDVYLQPRGRVGTADQLFYIRDPCRQEDTGGVFAGRFRREDGSPDSQWRDSFNGARVGSACVLKFAPPLGVVQVILRNSPFGQADRWRVAVRLDFERLRQAREAVRGVAPLARGEFDLYWRGGALTYLRAPCAPEDVRDRFFLHVVPQRTTAVPAARRDTGFDNLDFDFGERGARVDGVCVATVPVPYAAAWVDTGQFASGVRWSVRFEAR